MCHAELANAPSRCASQPPSRWLTGLCNQQYSLDDTGSGVFHQQHRSLLAVSHCSPAGALRVLLYLHSPAFSVSGLFAGNYQQGIGKNMLLYDFEMTTTTAHCLVPMPKRPSHKAGPSD